MSRAGVLVLNCGSSSLKCQLFELPAGVSLAQASVERVGQPLGRLKFALTGGEELVEEFAAPDHLTAIGRVLELFATRPELTIDILGHRVVHAGEAYTGSVLIDDDVIAALEACSELAPLHNPANLAGIRAGREALPGAPAVAVFDNALHHTLPPEVFLYGLPRELYDRHRVRRYGFHGVALRSMLEQVEALTGRPRTELRAVLLMLGSGCTACAVDRGRSIAVSTGFTPLEGLVQSTRCGDLDPGIVLDLLRQGRGSEELNTLFNRQSGLLGLSGVSPDMRDIEQTDSERARLALEVFRHRAVKYVGGYAADLGGLDVLAFGGGVGQNAPDVRAALVDRLGHLGATLDDAANAACRRGRAGVVSTPDSRVAVVVCAVDEELVIARDSYAVVTAAQDLPATAAG